MIGPRAVIGLSLLCALVFSAIAAGNAAAAANTTGFTCLKGSGSLDFADAHCDSKVTPGTGEYGHVSIKNDVTAEVTIDNSTTGGATQPARLRGKFAGLATEITCNSVHGTGTIHNVEPGEKKHNITGTTVVSLTNCSVQKPAKCDVKEPLEIKAEFEAVEGLGSEKNTMGLEFKPDGGGTVFGSVEFINNGAESCAINGKVGNVEGTAVATGAPSPAAQHAGATAIFTGAMTSETLTFGGTKAEFEATTTVKVKNGNPIVPTTTT